MKLAPQIVKTLESSADYFSDSEFKRSKNSVERSHTAASKLLEKPDSLPIILELHKKSTLARKKYRMLTVPNTWRISNIISYIRKNDKIGEDESVVIIGDKCIFKNNESIQTLYNNCAEEDGFLYLYYTNVPTFGNCTSK